MEQHVLHVDCKIGIPVTRALKAEEWTERINNYRARCGAEVTLGADVRDLLQTLRSFQEKLPARSDQDDREALQVEKHLAFRKLLEIIAPAKEDLRSGATIDL